MCIKISRSLTCHVVLLEQMVVAVEPEHVVVAATDADSAANSSGGDARPAAPTDAERSAGGAVRVGRRGGRAAGLAVLHQHGHGDPPRRGLQGEL